MKIGFKRLSSLLFISSFVLSACGPGQLFGSKATSTSTNIPTQIPTNTSTPQSTVSPTLSPTPTSIPTQTAIPAMGTPISNEDWEVTVVDATTHDRITGESGLERPGQGHIFVGVGVKIKNVDPEKNDLLGLRARHALIFEIFDSNGDPMELYKYGVAAQDMHPLFVRDLWTPENKQVDQAIYDFKFINIVANIDLQEYTTLSIRLILNAEVESLNSPFILQFQNVPLIQFSVKK